MKMGETEEEMEKRKNDRHRLNQTQREIEMDR
jgi:hypothetical protein